METAQRDVTDFHRAMGIPIGAIPNSMTDDRAALRMGLIEEEFKELAEALGYEPGLCFDREWDYRAGHGYGKRSLADAVDAIADLIYVALGTAVEMGVDMDPIWRAVHAANMAKVGGPKRDDGKQMKPPGWVPPPIAELVAAQVPPCQSEGGL